MKQKWIPLATAMLGCALASGTVSAASWADRVSIGGFSSANYNRTDNAAPFNGDENVGHDNQGTWSDSRLGINLNARINDRLRFATQLLGSQGEGFGLNVDWAFADIGVTDNLNLRAGKVKFPVGLVNEYVDVGYAMPWIRSPVVIYSELSSMNAPQMTREGYTGVSFLGNASAGDLSLNADLFTGEISLAGAGSEIDNSDPNNPVLVEHSGPKVRNLVGVAVTADWDDAIVFKASAYQGTMRGMGTGSAMEGEKHRATMFGVKADVANFIFYGEHARMKMGNLADLKATSWYTTLGYQIGKVLPHVTYQSYQQGDKGSASEDKQSIMTAGLRWDWMSGVALKVELSQIKTDKGDGLFQLGSNMPGTTVNMVGFGIDTVF